MTGVTKNQDISAIGTRCSTSRKKTLSAESPSEMPRENRNCSAISQGRCSQVPRGETPSRGSATASTSSERTKCTRLPRTAERGRMIAGEPRLLDEGGVAEHDPGGVSGAERKKLPDHDPDEQVRHARRKTHQSDEDQVDEHEKQRVEQRPEKAERRALVALLEIAHDEIQTPVRGARSTPQEVVGAASSPHRGARERSEVTNCRPSSVMSCENTVRFYHRPRSILDARPRLA